MVQSDVGAADYLVCSWGGSGGHALPGELSHTGPVVDGGLLASGVAPGNRAVFRHKTIRGAALDVYEHEPALSPGLAELENVILTPHTASATEETRQAMSELAAKNIIEALEGECHRI